MKLESSSRRRPRPRPPSRRARRLAWLLALFVLAVAPYIGSLGNPLLRDDRTLLRENQWLERRAGAATVFRYHYWHGTRHEQSDLYRPLTVLSLGWNLRAVPGVRGLRAANVLLHGLATLVACGFLASLFRRLRPDDPAWPAAWAGAALFAVHPMASEAVLFVTGRSEILSAICGLSAFTLLTLPGGVPGRAARVVGSALLFSAALGFKESAASWIPILALWWVWRRRADPFERSTIAAGTVAWTVALAAFLALRATVVGWLPHHPPWIDNPLVLEGAPTRVANAVLLLARYLGKMLFPATLGVEYGYDQLPVIPLMPWGALGALTVAACWFAVLVALRRLSPPAGFLWVFVPAAFAVTANVFFPIGTVFAERLAYLPLVGACGIAGVLIRKLTLRRTVAGFVLPASLLVVAGGRTFDRTRDFRDAVVFNEAAVAASPRAVKALANLGRTRLRQDRLEEGIELLQRAVAIWPDYSGALARLADAHARRGDRAAEHHYRRLASEAFARWQSGEAVPDRDD